jgi:heptosyltransferase-2
MDTSAIDTSDSSATAGGPVRILVVRNGFIGDTVLAIPFLRNLRRRYPDAVIDVLVEPRSGEVLADCPYKNELIAWKRPPRVRRVVHGSLANIVASARWLRTRRYDRAYVLKRSVSSLLLVWLAGIRHRIGFASPLRSPLLTRRVRLRRHRHEAESFLDLLRDEGIEIDDAHNENWIPESLAAKADAVLGRVSATGPRVFIAPRSTDVHRRWPLRRMCRVIEWLVRDRGCEVHLCGGPRDVHAHDTIRLLIGPDVAAHVHDHSAELSLRETVALLSRMDLCLGVDTGLPHIAASCGVPIVKLYGPTDPRQWHPWKAESAVVTAPHPSPTPMLDITVDAVIGVVRRMLDGVVEKRRLERARRPRLRTLDLRAGSHRYEIYSSALRSPSGAPAIVAVGAGGPQSRAAAVPATNPLAHAH